jgi:citrate lyase synthetase
MISFKMLLNHKKITKIAHLLHENGLHFQDQIHYTITLYEVYFEKENFLRLHKSG